MHIGKHRMILIPLHQSLKVDLHHMKSRLFLFLSW